MVRKSNIVSVGGGGTRAVGWGRGRDSYHYNSMSWASSSEKSDMELSDEESPAPSSCSFRASSVAYFWMYSVGGRKQDAVRGEELERYEGGRRAGHWEGRTFNLLLVLLRPVKVHGGCVSVQGVDGVGVRQQLGQERLKDVGQIFGGRKRHSYKLKQKVDNGWHVVF